MKIVVLGPAHPYRGGIAALDDRLAVELIKEGHEVTVYNFSLQYPKFLFPGKTQYTDDPAPKDVTILRKVNAVNPFNWWKVGRELKRLRPELVIVRFWLPFMGPALGTICRIARKNRYTRIICIADNIVPHEKRIGDRLLTSYFVKGVDGFIAMSQDVFGDLEKFVSHPVRRLAPHPVYDHYGDIISRETALTNLELNTGFRYLLFFGFIRDYKGLDILLESMTDERIRKGGIKLIVAGEFYGNEDFYQKLIQKYRIEDLLVMHTDYIPSEAMSNYFCAADLIVQPYRSATQSGVTQVGYHFNKPMLVSNVGGLAEIVADGKSGYVVEPRSHAIADAIVDFYENERAEAYSAETQKMKQKFSWSNLTQKIFEVYDELKNN